MSGTGERPHVLSWCRRLFYERGGDSVACRHVHEGTLVHMDDYRTRDRRRRRPPVIAYCLVSGVIATTAATVLSFTVSGVTSFAVWISVLVVICALAGLGYDSALLGAAWAARRRPHRH
jgi:hypothetical protein